MHAVSTILAADGAKEEPAWVCDNHDSLQTSGRVNGSDERAEAWTKNLLVIFGRVQSRKYEYSLSCSLVSTASPVVVTVRAEHRIQTPTTGDGGRLSKNRNAYNSRTQTRLWRSTSSRLPAQAVSCNMLFARRSLMACYLAMRYWSPGCALLQ